MLGRTKQEENRPTDCQRIPNRETLEGATILSLFYENGKDIEILMRLLMIYVCLARHMGGCYMRVLLREYDDDAMMMQ